MKCLGWILLLLISAVPTWAAKKITVAQLDDLLHSLQQAKKADAEVAAELKQVELTEELTRATMDRLASFIPGPLSTEQFYVLEAGSAVLAPPGSDLPSTPAPDAAAQKALLDKAIAYATNTYAQLPHLTATKTTFRFQDNMQAPVTETGRRGGAVKWPDASDATNGLFVRFIGSNDRPVDFQNGAEMLSKAKDQTQWGANGQIALLGQSPVLSAIVQDAQAAGNLNWLRWETVNGRQAAVFTFTVDKKKTHYDVNDCCFPDVDQVGARTFRNVQVYTHWNPYKGIVPYHGEIFVDSGTGIVVRLVTQAEFKSSEPVKQEDTRIDYGPVKVDGKLLVLPVRTIIDSVVVISGEDSATKYSTRRTLFTADYKNYLPAGAPR